MCKICDKLSSWLIKTIVKQLNRYQEGITMKKYQDLSFKMNTKRDSKSYNDNRALGDRLERKASVAFKQRKQKLSEEFAY
jgi:hypothetical protein